MEGVQQESKAANGRILSMLPSPLKPVISEHQRTDGSRQGGGQC